MRASFLWFYSVGLSVAISVSLFASDPLPRRYVQPATDGEMLSVSISNGDNDIVFHSPPIDSKENIDAFFDVLKNVYGAKRIYWRAGQIEQIINHSKPRPDNFSWYPLWDYLQRLYNEPGFNPSRTGVQSAKDRGLEIWTWCGLFDHGAQAAVETAKGTGPFPLEGKLRLNNPEWVPVDRHGFRRMAGPLCLGYPEARRALVDLFSGIALKDGYDGIMFHTYLENFDPRCEVEFVFNDPIVAAYREKYGVDIRTADFDPDKIAEIQGEFLMEFLRELHAVLKPAGVKIGIFLNPERPERPSPWLSARKNDFAPAGAIRIDWKRIMDEGLVDELVSYVGSGNADFAAEIHEHAKGTKTRAGLFRSAGHPEEFAWMRAAGVNRLIDGSSRDMEHGYFDPVGPEAIDSADFIARITFLDQMETGLTPVDPDLLSKATTDPHPWVRRRALAVMLALKIKEPRALEAIRNALQDPITGVRSYAVMAALQLGGSEMIEGIYESISAHYEPPVTFAARSGLRNLPAERTPDIILGTKHPDWQIRFLAARSLGGRQGAEPLEALLALTQDPEPRIRWAATEGLQSHPGEPSRRTLVRLLDDVHPTVRAMAALQLSRHYGGETRWIGPDQLEVFNLLRTRFARFDERQDREDAEWGWMPLGQALLAMGPRGREALEEFAADSSRLARAERAWELLNVKSSLSTFLPVSFDEIDASYKTHPRRIDGSQIEIKKIEEPELMPYLMENFDLRNREFAKDGMLGQSRGSGRWQGLRSRLRRNPVETGRSVVRLATGEKAESDWVDAVRSDFRIGAGKMIAEITLELEHPGEELAIFLTNSSSWSSSIRIIIAANGNLMVSDADGRLQSTDFVFEQNNTVLLRIEADLDGGRYSVSAVMEDGPPQMIAGEVSLLPEQSYNQIVFLPSKKPGGVFLIHALEWKVSNPAHPTPASHSE